MNILVELFIEFFRTGLFAVGGALVSIPFLYDIASRRDWMPIEMLPDMIAISESTPGPIGINMATYAGYQAQGITGGAVATFALVLPSLAIAILISKCFSRFSENSIMQSAMKGLRPAVAGLIAVAAWQIFDMAVLNSASSLNAGKFMIEHVNFKALLLLLAVFFLLLRFDKHPIYYIAASAFVGVLVF